MKRFLEFWKGLRRSDRKAEAWRTPAGADHETPTSPTGAPAVVMVTHFLAPRMLRHFERLKTECGLDAYLAYHAGAKEPRPDLADLNLGDDEIRACFPARTAEFLSLGRPMTHGYTDTVAATAALRPELSRFDRIWIIEYDVDFSGRWSDFFSSYSESEADFLTADIRRQADDPRWHHWKRFRYPPGVEPLASFQPVSRFSRRFLLAYRDHMRDTRWRGHCEAVLPSLARSLGMTVEDISGTGPFAPEHPRFHVTPATFGFLPLKSTSYFHEDPDLFSLKRSLYHPVKIERC